MAKAKQNVSTAATGPVMSNSELLKRRIWRNKETRTKRVKTIVKIDTHDYLFIVLPQAKLNSNISNTIKNALFYVLKAS